ncbi:MAG: glycosyltransferase [Candidatus Doudnabacteria bacterium]|nr:glycosyltransferase [Candidatus Doudnabacteria bacterium]
MNPKPRVLFIVTQGNWGGAQKYVYDLSRSFASKYEVLVCSGIEDSALKDELAKIGIPYIGIKKLVRRISLKNDLAAVYEIFRVIKKFKPRVVHLNSSKAGLLGGLAAKLASAPRILFTLHGLVLFEPMSKIRWLAYFLATRLTALCSDAFIAVSSADRQAALQYRLMSENKVHLCHIGLDLPGMNFYPEEEAKKILTELTGWQLGEQLLFATIADFYPTKGLADLISAVAQLAVNRPKWKFIIFGDGSDKNKLNKTITENSLEDRCRLISGVYPAAALLSGFDGFVLPSVKEGLPYALLEAAAAGLPIVATRVGGIPDLFAEKNSAILVPPQNSPALASAISQVAASKELREELGRNAKQAASGFTLEKMVQETEKIYRLV